MKIDKIIFGAAMLSISISTSAQVTKEVEVTQAFIPTVKEATKPLLMPDMGDDAYISPDIDYSITPISIHTEIDTTPYEAVELNYYEYNLANNYYAKVGVGYPFRSVADLYASVNDASRGYAVGFLNYSGDYADIESDFGDMNDAFNSLLRVGAAAGLYFDRRSLDAMITYDYDVWSRYATDTYNDSQPQYQRGEAQIRFGDNFTNWEGWNYMIGGGVERFMSSSNFDNLTVESDFAVGHTVAGGEFKFSFGYGYRSGEGDYLNTTFGGDLLYGFRGERWRAYVGVGLYQDRVSFSTLGANVATSAVDTTLMGGADFGGEDSIENKSFYAIPRLDVEYNTSVANLAIFASVEGSVRQNDFSSLSEQNPYLVAGLFGAKSSVDYDMSIGVRGIAGQGKLGYSLSGGYKITKNNLFWAFTESAVSLDYVENGFIANLATLNNLYGALSLDYHPLSNLKFEAEVVVNNYSYSSDQLWEATLPTVSFNLRGEYSVGKFDLALKGELLSSRKNSVISTDLSGYSAYSVVEIPSAFDLGFSADYRLNGGLVLFCELSNLLNQDQYRWVRYREYGIGAMVGAKIVF
ncbi:MAG: hypothetical protein R3Y16_00490 [Rikenellaceae bacterium]